MLLRRTPKFRLGCLSRAARVAVDLPIDGAAKRGHAFAAAEMIGNENGLRSSADTGPVPGRSRGEIEITRHFPMQKF